MRFETFKQFITEVGLRPSASHSIDRIDNSGHYEPGNVRWADRFEQANNTRKNRNLTLGRETKTLAQWGRDTGFGSGVIEARIDSYGWSVERALTTPVKGRAY